MWECKKCGTRYSENFNHCPNCGTQRDGNQKTSIDVMKVVLPITFLIIAVCAIIVTVNSSKGRDNSPHTNTTFNSQSTVVAPSVTQTPTVQTTPNSAPKPTQKPAVDHSNLSTTGKTVSDEGVAIEYPAERDFFEEPFSAVVKASRADGSIYIMPKPKSGNGNLGTVRSGTTVTIWAERNGCYFFETSDGVMGWNGTMYFTMG